MFSKKAQNAAEFLMILVFILTIITLFIYVMSQYLIIANEQSIAQEAESFGKTIDKEIKILNKVEPGYYRELPILHNRYDLNITYDRDGNAYSLIIFDNNNYKYFYHDLIGTYNKEGLYAQVNLTNKTIDGISRYVFIFEKYKKNTHLNQGIDLVNVN